MNRRLVALLATIIITAACLAGIGWLYERSKAALIAEAQDELRITAQKAAADASLIFEAGPQIIDRIEIAGLSPDDRADLQRTFFALTDFPIKIYRQVNSVYIGLPDGSFYDQTDLIPDQLVKNGEVDADYQKLIRRVISRDGQSASDIWYYRGAGDAWRPAKTSAGPAGYDPRTRPWYQAAVERNNRVWSKPYRFASSGELGITVSEPLRDANGATWGVVGVDFSLADLAAVTQRYEADHVGSEGFMFVADERGALIGHTRLDQVDELLRADPKLTLEQATSIHKLHSQTGDDLAAFDVLTEAGVRHFRNGDRDVLATRLPIDPTLRLAEQVYVGRSLVSVVGAAIADLRRNIAVLLALIVIVATVAFYAVKLRHEVAARKAMEAEVRRSNANLAHAQELGRIGNAEVDLATGAAIWSEQQFRLYGLDPSSDVPDMRRIYAMIHPDDTATIEAMRARNLLGEDTPPAEYRIVRTDGQVRWVHREVEIVRDAGGRPIKYFATQQDITDRKEAEQAMHRAKEMAEEATRMKSSFLAMMSHEIRTPMNGVMAMAEMLDQTELTVDQHGMSSVIRSSATALLTIINDILDFSKIEAGKLDIERVPFSLCDVVESAGELIGSRAEERGIRLIIDADPALPDALIGDPTRLRQILLNLIGNAIKFTETGHILVRVARKGTDDDGLRLRFEVIDTGIGLDEDRRAKLFQPFVQADSSTSRKYGGTGLGLSICHRLCAMMGGEIGVTSALGQGSTFWFELPFAVSDAAPLRPAVEIVDARIAAIGFADLEREALARLLGAAGIADIKWNGEVSDGGVVLLHVTGDGAAALDAIRGLRTKMRVLAVAPRALASTLAAAAGAGVFATLTTPVRRQRLWHVIAAAQGRADLGQRQASAKDDVIGWAPPPVDEAREAGALVLVAEDNPTNQIVVRRMLNQRGYAHEMAENGAVALSMYERGGYGLLLTDFHMPVMDGLQLTAEIRARERSSSGHLPIVALTADALSDAEKAGLDAGMDAYLAKPINSQAFNAALAKFLPQGAALRRRPEQTSPEEARAAAATAEPEISPDVLDLARIRETFGGIAEAMSFLDSFAGDVPAMVEAIAVGLTAGDRATARHAAHALKGAARSSGANRLGQLAADIQDRLDDDDLDTAVFLFDAFPPTCRELEEAIGQLHQFAAP